MPLGLPTGPESCQVAPWPGPLRGLLLLPGWRTQPSPGPPPPNTLYPRGKGTEVVGGWTGKLVQSYSGTFFSPKKKSTSHMMTLQITCVGGSLPQRPAVQGSGMGETHLRGPGGAPSSWRGLF